VACAAQAGAFIPSSGEVIAVVGAGGNVGQLVTRRLCELGDYKVRAVLRDSEKAKASWAGDLLQQSSGSGSLELFEADTRDYAALQAALADASVVICTTGVPAFGISGQWKDGNHPVSVDHYGVKNAAHAFGYGSKASKRRFVVMSSIGVTRRDSFPYLILNGGGVLDAKAAGEAAVRAIADTCGFATAIVRPGQLFGGPYDNNRYLGTLFELDKDAATKSVALVRGDTAVGDTVRSALAGVLVRCAVADGPQHMDFAVISEEGSAPSEEDIDALLANPELTATLDSETSGPVDEQFDRRVGLGLETATKAATDFLGGLESPKK